MKKCIASLLTITFWLVGGVFGQGTTQDSLDSRLSSLVQQISDGLTENQKQKIAVVEFADLKGNVTDFGRYLAEELITRLHQARKFKVVERNMLNKIIAEQKLSLTGAIEPTSAQKLGKLLGVDAIASGSISDLGKSFKVNARLINTETGEVFSVAATEIIKDEAVCALGGCGLGNNASNENRESTTETNNKVIRADASFFTFEIKECVLSATVAVCDLLITNKDEDRNFVLYGRYWQGSGIIQDGGGGTRAFDDNNNSYSAKGAEIANNRKDQTVRVSLISDIPTKARIYFEGVDTNAKKFTVLQIGYQTSGMDLTYVAHVEVRNVPIRKK